MMIPDVGYHVPEALEQYNKYEVEEITVYVKKNVNTLNDRLEFTSNKFLLITTLEVIGVEV